MAIDNLPVSSIPDFSRSLQRNVQHPPGITRSQTPGMGMEGKEGKASSYILAWAGQQASKGAEDWEEGKEGGGLGFPFKLFSTPPTLFAPARQAIF